MDLISAVTGSGALGWLYGFWQLATCHDAATSGDLAQETYTPGDAGVQKAVPDSNFKSLRPLKRRMGASNWPWMRPSVKSVQSAAKKVLIST